MSSSTNNVGNQPLNDVQYLLPSAVLSQLAFAGVSFTAATAVETSLMQAGARQWEQERAFQNEKNDAVETILSRMPVGRNTLLNALLEQIKGSQTPAQLQMAVNAIETAIASAERLYGEQHDPDVETTAQRMDRLWARIEELTEEIDDLLEGTETPEERANRLAAEERMRAAQDNHLEAIQSGDSEAIGVAAEALDNASQHYSDVTNNNINAAEARGDMLPENAAAARGLVVQRSEVVSDFMGLRLGSSPSIENSAVQQPTVRQGAGESTVQPESVLGDEASAVLAMSRRGRAASQTQAEAPALVTAETTASPTNTNVAPDGTVLPTLPGVVLADAAAPTSQLTGMARPTQSGPGIPA